MLRSLLNTNKNFVLTCDIDISENVELTTSWLCINATVWTLMQIISLIHQLAGGCWAIKIHHAGNCHTLIICFNCPCSHGFRRHLYQRRILNIWWSDFMSNLTISKNTGLPDIRAAIRDKRLALFGHAIRLPGSTSAHNALLATVKLFSGTLPDFVWKRDPGRPRNSWLRWSAAFSRTHSLPHRQPGQ